jgi:hypothetical protein
MLPARDQGEASRLRFAASGVRATGCDPAKDSRSRQSFGSAEAAEGTRRAPRGELRGHEPRQIDVACEAPHTGRDERIALLRSYFPDVLTAMSRVARFSEDAVDAYAMLWTARRLVEGVGQTLPETPAFDQRGLRMEIVA